MTRDPFTLLQLANPVAAEDLGAPLTTTTIAELHQRIVEAPLSSPASHRDVPPGYHRRWLSRLPSWR